MNLTYYKAGTPVQGYTIQVDGWYAIVNQNGAYAGYGVAKGKGPGVITGINGGTWYPSLGQAIQNRQPNLVLVSDNSEGIAGNYLTPNCVSSLTIDLNGNTLTGSFTIPAKYTPTNSTTEQNNGFSMLTIKDSTMSGSDYNSGSGATINVGNGTAKATSTTITLNNVKVGGITAKYTTACTVNVYGSETDAISLTGTSGGQINLGNGNTKGKATRVSLTTDGTAQGGTITATDAETQGITLSGVGASLTGTNLDVTGAITLSGLNDGSLTESQKNTLNTPTVTLYNSKVSKDIMKGTDVLTKAYSVTLNNNTRVASVNLTNANVTVNNSAAGAITVENGDVKLNGSATGPASAGVITLGKDKAAASLTVTGTNVTTGNITAAAGTVNITVPESETNNFGTLTSTVPVANRGINGGVWGSEVPIENLNTNLRYQTFNKKDGTRYRYYSDTQFQNVLDAYHVGPDTTVITLVKDSAKKKDNTITFKDGDDVVAILSYGTANLPFVLPSAINGRTVLKWSEYRGSDLLSEPAPGTTYSTPSTPDNRVLNAQATDTTITKLAGVTSGMNGVTARLDGNVITLSGAVNANNTSIIVTVTTDGNPNQTATIVIIYDNGKVYFANQNATLPSAMRISNDSSTLIIGNGTASYTLNGSGLRGLAKGLEGKVHGYATTTLPVLVTVNCSGTGWTNVRKTELGNYMSNDVGSGSSAFGANGLITLTESGSSVDFSDSPAVKEALNAAVAGITQSQIDSWILNAQNTAWRKNNTTNPTASDRASTGYSEVHVVAYMAVNITNYNTANKPGTMTMTLTPSYYVEVTGKGGTKVTDTDFALDTSKSNELNALRPVNNRSLGSLTGEMGTIKLTLEMESVFDRTYPVAHQGGTYAYPENFEKAKASSGNSMTFNITHAINGALGQFIVDGQQPMVTRYNKKGGDKAAQAHYDTLQAAVDDAENGQYIEVDANYKGSCNITVTGTARKFTINTNGANKVTSNVSGVVTELPGGNEYQVQLVKDTLTPSGNVAITVVSVANGYARVSASSVKPGSVVTITTVPNVGYAATTPSVRYSTKNVASNVLGVTAVGTNTWSFTVPADATGVTVTPGFVLIGGTTVPFTDVAATAWYYGGVEYCYNTVRGSNRLMEGLSTTTFGPTRPFTRAEVVTILWNMKGRPSSGYTNRTYTDVGTNHWAYNAIVWATNNGYAEGYPGGAFRPSQSVTREEMVVFLWRAAGKPTGYSSTNLNAYTDGYNVHDWAQNAMRWALGYGVLSGQNSVGLGGTIAPRAVAYRSEVAVTVMNFDKLALFR